MRVFYFGCWGGTGHRLWTPEMASVSVAGPWTLRDLDASPLDSHGRDTGRGMVSVDPGQREGVWRLTRKDGWTALGAWDRSVDIRGGSVAVFVAEGTHGELDMQSIAAQAFPNVWARIQGHLARRPS